MKKFRRELIAKAVHDGARALFGIVLFLGLMLLALSFINHLI